MDVALDEGEESSGGNWLYLFPDILIYHILIYHMGPSSSGNMPKMSVMLMIPVGYGS